MKVSVARREAVGLTPCLEPAARTADFGGEGVEKLKEAGAFGTRLLQDLSPPPAPHHPKGLTLSPGVGEEG